LVSGRLKKGNRITDDPLKEVQLKYRAISYQIYHKIDLQIERAHSQKNLFIEAAKPFG